MKKHRRVKLAGLPWVRAANHHGCSRARRKGWHSGIKITALKTLSFLARMFRPPLPMKQFSQATKPFSVFEQTSGNSGWLSVTNETAHRASTWTGDSQCGRSALSWPSPSSWPVPRWLVLPTAACRASAASPIAARRRSHQRRPSLLRTDRAYPTKFQKKSIR